ncbi:hypothetical protein F3Y22_tig00117011pilonHSYRG00011 [Hibiscus syriacus]|uniref:Uncharacterized protein n=1 Tax=Hibiscus syriacus TaxID=106335 RepID=A0A6A2XCB6_HIBSY|nr:hypothetical protein F3Y22_tig00117011pilonHSYRG00011 [Hibiscus syriacus]
MKFLSSSTENMFCKIDFNDVFGGPPRRPSVQEIRYSFGEDVVDSTSDETVVASRNPWSGLSEKPVYSEEVTLNRRRCSRNDFFDDIFRGNQSLTSSPRKYEMRTFCTGFTDIEPFFSIEIFVLDTNLYSTFAPESDDNWFHFSIYKWANKGGVPFAIPLRGSHRFKDKDKLQGCSSANGWIACEGIAVEPKEENLHNNFSTTDRMSSEDNKKHNSLIDGRNKFNEPVQIIKEGNVPKSRSESWSKSAYKKVSGDTILPSSKAEKKTQYSISPVGKETYKPRLKPPNNVDGNGKGRGRGNVKEFIKIFNQDGSLKPRADVATENHRSRLKQKNNKIVDIFQFSFQITRQLNDAEILRYLIEAEPLMDCSTWVLWVDSGWKPVPLQDIIGRAVKKSYQSSSVSSSRMHGLGSTRPTRSDLLFARSIATFHPFKKNARFEVHREIFYKPFLQ